MPELLRINGEIMLREGASDVAAAVEPQFLQSLDWPRRQEALAASIPPA